MPHSVDLITTIAAALGLALIFGFVAVRLKLPALIGYLLAGGVMLLMFGVGLHFSLADLLSVKKIALPGAVVQIAEHAVEVRVGERELADSMVRHVGEHIETQKRAKEAALETAPSRS